MSLIRLPLTDYGKFVKQLINKGSSFKVIETSYTKRIKVGKNTILFADKPITPPELKLIQQIRQSADEFEVATMTEGKPQIDFYKFYDFQNHKKINGVKIDLNQAYWQAATNIGLITPEIQYYFEECKSELVSYYADEFDPEKDLQRQKKTVIKLARLRTLGALATRKTLRTYEGGELVEESTETNEPHRQLYLYLCEQVAEVMSAIAYEFSRHVIYYYWDCIFLSSNVDTEKVNQRIKELGYNSKIDGQGEFNIIKGQHVSYLHDLSKDIKYPIMNTDLI